MKGSLTYTYELLDSIEVAEAGSIVSPIQTAINPITREDDNLTFTYPYVLMLVIMFMGLMLGSTLVVVDKTSHAAFRNFTTSTRDEFHIFMSYLTTLLVLLAQVFIILLFSYFLVSTPLLNNFATSIFIILIAISLWSFLGMIIGYLSNNQESSMIACLTIGSISLFISNLVIPIEGMNQLIRVFTYVNPYVVLSEMLKKSMLFNIPTGGFGAQLLIMLIVVIALFIAIILVQRYMKKRYFTQMRTVEVKAVKKAVKPLEIMGRPVKDEFQLLTVLDLMTRADFQKLVTENSNPIYIWIRDEIGDKKLAGSLKTTSKERMILALDKRLKKMTRKSIRKK
jgi:ABC-type multidrug transport system permease subunit